MIDTVNNSEIDFRSTFTKPDFGKEHLVSALDSGSEETFLLALHDVMDAILKELESDEFLVPLDRTTLNPLNN